MPGENRFDSGLHTRNCAPQGERETRMKNWLGPLIGIGIAAFVVFVVGPALGWW
jgi:hypothetical protein